ncbi:MAG: hypothetical protein WC310_05180 [Patescibacteria group bacterium]|jgi:uridine kinase
MGTTLTIDYPNGLKNILTAMTYYSKPALIAIAGCSCSGKSFLAKALNEASPATILPLDNFFRDIDDPALPRDKNNRHLFEAPESYWKDQYLAAAVALLTGKTVILPTYDLATNKRLPTTGQTVSPNTTIVAEGLYAITFLSALSAPVLKVFLDTDLEICLNRRIARDVPRWNITAEKVREIFFAKVLPYYQMFIAKQKSLADIVIKE